MKRLRPVPSLLAVVIPTFTVALILMALSWLADLSGPGTVFAEPRATIPPPTATTTPTTSTLYLPTILNNAWVGQRPAVPWGLQYDPYQEHTPALYSQVISPELGLAYGAGFRIVRTHLFWTAVEPTDTVPSAYDWSAYDVLFGDYAAHDFTTLVSIVGYPMWATTFNCGGGLHENWQPAWREFVREAVARYSKPPYNVHLWEIGNEVDGEATVDPDDYDRPPELGQGQPTVPYAGCWGDMAADYLSFMRAAYEEIHGQDSSAQVLIGSLAYDQFENWFVEDFFPNVLDAGGGNYFDVLGFHWYPFSTQAWPTANDKAQDLAAIMQSRGIRKPLWLTETYRWTHSVDSNSPRAQFDFALHELPRMAGGGIIQRAIWFGMWDFNPGRSPIGRGMVDFWHQPKPALRAMEAMSGLAYGFPTDIGNSQVEAYRFDRPWALESVYALWSRDSSSHDFSVAATKPVQRVRVFFANTYTGTQVVTNTLVPSGGQVTAHAEPGTQFLIVPAQ